MKVLVATLITTLVIFLPADKDLKLILKDGHFSKLPKTVKVIGHEIVTDQNKRYGYLAFEAKPGDIMAWIKKSKLVLTSKEEIFEKNILVRPTERPIWFKDSSDKFATGDLYYSKRETDHFTTLCWVDLNIKVIHLEYEIHD